MHSMVVWFHSRWHVLKDPTTIVRAQNTVHLTYGLTLTLTSRFEKDFKDLRMGGWWLLLTECLGFFYVQI